MSKRAQGLLRTILDDVPKIREITTSQLLYRCQELSWILELDKETKLWIDQELTGYSPQVFGKSQLPPHANIPRYRLINLPAKVVTSRKDSKATDGSHIFSVVSPCHSLEHAVNSLTLSESIVDRKARPSMMLTYTGTISADSLKGISAAIRARVQLFAIQLSLATQVGTTMSGFFDNTLVRIAERVGALSPPTLDILNDAVKKLKKSQSQEELRVILETLRTILRSITSVIITKEMLKENDEPPSEKFVSIKTSKILDWVLKQFDGRSKKEIQHLRNAVTRYHDQLKMLNDLINKPIHKEIQSVDKAQVERIMISVIAWLGDIVDILDRAGYEWKRNEL